MSREPDNKTPTEAASSDGLNLREVLAFSGTLADLDAESAPGFDPKRWAPKAPDTKTAGRTAGAAMADELSDLQERLYAAGKAGGNQKVLLVVQGMDTSGKGGVMRHAVGLMDPQGVAIKAFKAPSEEERSHDFLWRIERALPGVGIVGVFDRSHYEDVLIARVREFASPEEIERRYGAIADFEQALIDNGTTLIKVVLYLSKDEQKQRLLGRLTDESKYWKYNPGDVDERQRWDDYMAAYQIVLDRCSEVAPFYVVPANKKWYKDWAVARLLLEHLRELNLGWPAADFDVATEIARVEAS